MCFRGRDSPIAFFGNLQSTGQQPMSTGGGFREVRGGLALTGEPRMSTGGYAAAADFS